MGVNMKRSAIYEKLLFGVFLKKPQLSWLYLDSLLSEALFSVGDKMIKIFVFVKYSIFNLYFIPS